MEELMNYCKGKEKEAMISILTSVGTRHCVLTDKYFSYTVKILECMDNFRELILYYYIIEMANVFYLKNNNLIYENMIINDINSYFNGFSSEDIDICRKFINEFFNDEYKTYFEGLKFGDQK